MYHINLLFFDTFFCLLQGQKDGTSQIKASQGPAAQEI